MITLDIVTPAKKIVEGAQVNSVTLPSVQGEMTILPHHAELMAVLGTGVLSFALDGTERRFAVSYGFVEVRGDKVSVLAETIEEPKEIDKSRALESQRKAEQVLSGTTPMTDEDFKKNQNRLQRALIRQHLAS